MHIVVRNVNEAFYTLVEGVQNNYMLGEDDLLTETSSRNGGVLAFNEPVIVTYEKPLERVLFDRNRDANPFFHLFESIWMLAGSNALAPLTYFLPRYADFSDDGKTVNGAYGYRWRHATETYIGSTPAEDELRNVDQLSVLIDHLRQQPNSRRAVLSMWNVENDLVRVGTSKDVCCNLCVCFSVRTQPGIVTEQGTFEYVEHKWLDMTVFNRSNDLIWGTLGANAVHFSYLQQYIADCLGVKVGVYNQVSNNLHVYTNNWKPEEWLRDKEHNHCYPALPKMKLVEDKDQFDLECVKLVSLIAEGKEPMRTYKEPYINDVVVPMILAFMAHKRRDYTAAFNWAYKVQSTDWARAACEWLARRHDKYKNASKDKLNRD